MKKLFLILTALILIFCLGCWGYLSDYYPAGANAKAAMVSDMDITVETKGDFTVFSPTLPEAGFLFYPGAKVEYTAYAPLIEALAERNILCILVEMPGNLAILDVNAADEIPLLFPEIDRWYIGGHSLGGSMAADWASRNCDVIDGLVLLASYSTADLTASGMEVLSVYGSCDQVLNRENYQENLQNLPEDMIELVIQGGNHAQFGDYGHQEGDGEADLSPEEQLGITADAIAEFILK